MLRGVYIYIYIYILLPFSCLAVLIYIVFVGYRKLSHDGTHGQSRCLMTMLPEPEIGVFSCFNGYGKSQHDVSLQLINMLVTDMLLGE